MTITESSKTERKIKVEVTANYLPSTEKYREDYARTSTIGDAKKGIMTFFGVKDFTDRDTHTFHLLFEGKQRDDLSTTLEAMLRNERHTAHFQLIERIQAG